MSGPSLSVGGPVRLSALEVQSAGLVSLWSAGLGHVAFYARDLPIDGDDWANHELMAWVVPDCVRCAPDTGRGMVYRASAAADELGVAVLEASPPHVDERAQELSFDAKVDVSCVGDVYALAYEPSSLLSPPVAVLPLVLERPSSMKRLPHATSFQPGWRIYNGVLVGHMVATLLGDVPWSLMTHRRT